MSDQSNSAVGPDASASKIFLPVMERRFGNDRRKKQVTTEPTCNVDELRRQLALAQESNKALSLAFADAIAKLDQDYRAECIDLLTKLITAVAPNLAAAAALSELMTFISERSEESAGATMVQVGAKAAEIITDAIDAQALTDAGIELTIDETMNEHAINAKWRDGAFCHNPDELISTFLKILQHETATDMKEG